MKTKREITGTGRLARKFLTLSALALGVVALGALTTQAATSKYGGGNPNTTLALTNFYPTHFDTQRYTYFEQLPKFDPRTKLETNEMRIAFMGSSFPMVHRAQKEMSLFVEVGWDNEVNRPLDSFVFDIGCGASANYTSMGIDFGRMNKIFLNHLHADHITDLIQIYSFGNAADRKVPLYVWGNGNSGVRNPGNYPTITDPKIPRLNYSSSPEFYEDSIVALCKNLRAALRWQTESQAFQTSAWTGWPSPAEVQAAWGLPMLPVPSVDDDPYQDSNALIPVELKWQNNGWDPITHKANNDNIAYNNQDPHHPTGAKIMHFPVIHCRKGAIGYKLEWKNPRDPNARTLSMIYTSDTKPETNSIDQACNYDANHENPRGVDVFIHEMILPPDALVYKMGNMTGPPPVDDPSFKAGVTATTAVEASSHTPQGAFGYLLSQIYPRPRLTVATHFPTSDDTVANALRSIQAHCQDIKKVGDQLVWSFDLMVLRVFPDKIIQCRAAVNDFSFSAPSTVSYPNDQLYAPKYHTSTGDWDPTVQLDRSAEIAPSDSTYRADGW